MIAQATIAAYDTDRVRSVYQEVNSFHGDESPHVEGNALIVEFNVNEENIFLAGLAAQKFAELMIEELFDGRAEVHSLQVLEPVA